MNSQEHKAEAEEWLQAARGSTGYEAAMQCIASAQVHATLATAPDSEAPPKARRWLLGWDVPGDVSQLRADAGTVWIRRENGWHPDCTHHCVAAGFGFPVDGPFVEVLP